jgi:hypothetical protein
MNELHCITAADSYIISTVYNVFWRCFFDVGMYLSYDEMFTM